MTDGPQFRLIHLNAPGGVEYSELFAKPNPGHPVIFAPDGLSLVEGGASAAHGDNVPTPDRPAEVRFWDLATRQVKLVLPTAPGAVSSLAFSPDGRILVAGHTNGCIYLWYAASPKDVNAYSAIAGH